jgi:uncharacterized protein with von Willebrand factor type A (vWA) domain
MESEMITKADLSKRDYVLIIDKSGSMSEKDCSGGKSRWNYCAESAYSLANKMAEFDDDGIDLYLFSSNFKKYPNTTPEKVKDIFLENDPSGSTALHLVLKDVFNDYFNRKKLNAKPLTVLVITDGEPDDKVAVAKVIVDAANKIKDDDELGISFIQVGRNEGARKFLVSLDDDLKNCGASFDIVDTVTMDDMENMSLSDVLLNAVND